AEAGPRAPRAPGHPSPASPPAARLGRAGPGGTAVTAVVGRRPALRALSSLAGATSLRCVWTRRSTAAPHGPRRGTTEATGERHAREQQDTGGAGVRPRGRHAAAVPERGRCHAAGRSAGDPAGHP